MHCRKRKEKEDRQMRKRQESRTDLKEAVKDASAILKKFIVLEKR